MHEKRLKTFTTSNKIMSNASYYAILIQIAENINKYNKAH